MKKTHIVKKNEMFIEISYIEKTDQVKFTHLKDLEDTYTLSLSYVKRQLSSEIGVIYFSFTLKNKEINFTDDLKAFFREFPEILI